MRKICFMRNTIQEYAWGSRKAIAELLGETSPSSAPQAELWMGAHPKAPSEVKVDEGWTPLTELISRYPKEILGDAAADKFHGQLPYLFKVLAAAKPLSIQAHPNQNQARQGFDDENRQGIPLTAGHRNYKDPHHKPECICALSEFWALNGFRPFDDIGFMLGPVCPSCLAEELGRLEARPDRQSFQRLFKKMMTLDTDRRREAVAHVLLKAQPLARSNQAYRWVLRLAEEYPDDTGVLAPLYLNLVCLQAGEAMFLPAGVLHAYLEGLGMELMANSDNVLRGGLTPKHVDVAELLKVLNFEADPIRKLTPEEIRPNEYGYVTPAAEFQLSVIRIDPASGYHNAARRSVEILICTEGQGRALSPDGGESLTLSKGSVILVPAALPEYQLTGNAVFYKAGVPV